MIKLVIFHEIMKGFSEILRSKMFHSRTRGSSGQALCLVHAGILYEHEFSSLAALLPIHPPAYGWAAVEDGPKS